MTAIEVRYLPATNTKGSRYRVKSLRFSAIFPKNQSMSDNDSMRSAAEQFLDRFDLKWTIKGPYSFDDGETSVFIAT